MRNYYDPEMFAKDPRLMILPLGLVNIPDRTFPAHSHRLVVHRYRAGMWSGLSKDDAETKRRKPSSHRQYLWSFAGGIKSNRKEMLAAFKGIVRWRL